VVKRSWYVTASIALLSVFVFTSATIGGMWAWWAWGPVEQAYIPTGVERHRAEVGEEGVTLHREFRITRPVTVTITRELVGVSPVMGTFRVALPPSVTTYEPGDYTLARLVPMPTGIPAGEYEIRNTVRWRANPVRDAEVDLPPVKVRVP
jgi:hypothetical protein